MSHQKLPPGFRIQPGDRFRVNPDEGRWHVAKLPPIRTRAEAPAVVVAECGERLEGHLERLAPTVAGVPGCEGCKPAYVGACPSCGSEPGCNIDCSECKAW